jgi:hypothetical protein
MESEQSPIPKILSFWGDSFKDHRNGYQSSENHHFLAFAPNELDLLISTQTTFG